LYSADIGRFLQPDTIVPGAGNPQALNRYSYVLNNPMTYNDPSGHCIPEINCPAGMGGGTDDPICHSCQGGMTFEQWLDWQNENDTDAIAMSTVPLECMAMPQLCNDRGGSDDWIFWSLPGPGDANDLAGIFTCSIEHLECGRWSSVPISAVGFLFGIGGSGLSRGDDLSDAAIRIFKARERGLGAEEVFGISPVGKTGIKGPNGNLRIPDLIDRQAHIVGEVKNRGYVSYSRQLRDLVEFAAAQGDDWSVVIAVREDTRLSMPVWDLVAQGRITLNQRADLP